VDLIAHINIAYINAGGIRMNHLQAEVCALDFSLCLPPLLAVHLVPRLQEGALTVFLGGLRWLTFHVLLFPG
jgi:hypothetical protein